MRTVFAAAASLLLLTSAALAQANAIIDPEMLPENIAIDQKYRNALKRLPDPESTNDPWRSVRSSENDSSKAKGSKKTSTH